MKLKYIAIIFQIFILNSCSKNEADKPFERQEVIIENDADGNPNRVGLSLNGKKTGEWKLFIRGRLAAVINYKNDLTHGKEIWYDRCSGRMIEDGCNEFGKPVGLWYRYTNGELSSISLYQGDSTVYVYENKKYTGVNGVNTPSSKYSSDLDCTEH